MPFKPIPAIQTKAMFTVCQQQIACPKCSSPAGFYCASPNGKKCDKPHGERIRAYTGSITPQEMTNRHAVNMRPPFL